MKNALLIGFIALLTNQSAFATCLGIDARCTPALGANPYVIEIAKLYRVQYINAVTKADNLSRMNGNCNYSSIIAEIWTHKKDLKKLHIGSSMPMAEVHRNNLRIYGTEECSGQRLEAMDLQSWLRSLSILH